MFCLELYGFAQGMLAPVTRTHAPWHRPRDDVLSIVFGRRSWFDDFRQTAPVDVCHDAWQ